MATHTVGQQVGHVQQDWVEIWGPDDADGSHEVLGSAIGDNREANAALWAAAPDLLMACKALADCLQDHINTEAKRVGVDPAILCPCATIELPRALAAIAKAKGE